MASATTVKSVPFFPYQAFYASHRQEYDECIRDVLSRGAFIMQRDLEEFEAALASYLGVKHCVGMANCTDALLVACRAAGLGPGDEVILPSHTFVASAAAIHFAGATPVPIECGADHLIDPAAIVPAITERTRAIMPVSLNGRSCKFDEIRETARRHDLLIIEDSAQALGSSHKGVKAGTAGLVGTFSFYPAKILGCFGDGGALVTDDDDVARFARRWRDHGRDPETGEVECWGMNSRLDNLQAALLHLQLNRYGETIERRRHIATLYEQGLSDVEALRLPPAPDASPDHFDVYQNYEIEADDGDALRTALAERGVGTLVQWGGKAVHQWPALGFDAKLPNTERLFETMLLLPMNQFMSDDDANYVIECARGHYGQ